MRSSLRLWLCVVLTVSVAACQARCGGAPTGASAGFNPIAMTGAQSWTIDGVSRNIDATYYLHLPPGFQFTIEVPVTSVPPDQATAVEAAWPFIRYAYKNGVYLRTQVDKIGSGPVAPSMIGVALVVHQGPRATGRRVAMSVAEIEARIGNEK
jgi:hypothetical protein